MRGWSDRILTRVRARKCPAFEFTFGLEPIVQVTAWFFAARDIDFVCAPPTEASAACMEAAWVLVLSFPFRFDGILISLFLA